MNSVSPAPAAVNPVREALAAGYRHGVPPWCPSVREIDAPLATAEPCDLCGKLCTFVPLFRTAPRSYRAFARCTGCGHAVEF